MKTLVRKKWHLPVALVVLAGVAIVTYLVFHSSGGFAYVLPSSASSLHMGMPYEDFTTKYADLDYRDRRYGGNKAIEISFKKQNDYKFFDEWTIYFDEGDRIKRLEGVNTHLTSDDEKEIFKIMKELVDRLPNPGLKEDYGQRYSYKDSKEAYSSARFHSEGSGPYDNYEIILTNNLNRSRRCLEVEIATRGR